MLLTCTPPTGGLGTCSIVTLHLCNGWDLLNHDWLQALFRAQLECLTGKKPLSDEPRAPFVRVVGSTLLGGLSFLPVKRCCMCLPREERVLVFGHCWAGCIAHSPPLTVPRPGPSPPTFPSFFFCLVSIRPLHFTSNPYSAWLPWLEVLCYDHILDFPSRRRL